MVNADLTATPELINSDPYGAGWICEVTTESSDDVANLLDAAAYRELTNG